MFLDTYACCTELNALIGMRNEKTLNIPESAGIPKKAAIYGAEKNKIT